MGESSPILVSNTLPMSLEPQINAGVVSPTRAWV
jgi:hypothetical protein